MKSGEHKDMRMPFGAHGPKPGIRGKLIADLPDQYLVWLLDQEWIYKEELYTELVKQLKIEDQYRKKFNKR